MCDFYKKTQKNPSGLLRNAVLTVMNSNPKDTLYSFDKIKELIQENSLFSQMIKENKFNLNNLKYQEQFCQSILFSWNQFIKIVKIPIKPSGQLNEKSNKNINITKKEEKEGYLVRFERKYPFCLQIFNRQFSEI